MGFRCCHCVEESREHLFPQATLIRAGFSARSASGLFSNLSQAEERGSKE